MKKGTQVVQLMIDERYNFFAVMSDGTVYKKRAKGLSHNYDKWQKWDIIAEIEKDLW